MRTSACDAFPSAPKVCARTEEFRPRPSIQATRNSPDSSHRDDGPGPRSRRDRGGCTCDRRRHLELVSGKSTGPHDETCINVRLDFAEVLPRDDRSRSCGSDGGIELIGAGRVRIEPPLGTQALVQSSLRIHGPPVHVGVGVPVVGPGDEERRPVRGDASAFASDRLARVHVRRLLLERLAVESEERQTRGAVLGAGEHRDPVAPHGEVGSTRGSTRCPNRRTIDVARLGDVANFEPVCEPEESPISSRGIRPRVVRALPCRTNARSPVQHAVKDRGPVPKRLPDCLRRTSRRRGVRSASRYLVSHVPLGFRRVGVHRARPVAPRAGRIGLEHLHLPRARPTRSHSLRPGAAPRTAARLRRVDRERPCRPTRGPD